MSNGILEKIVEELSDKIKEVDDALIMDVVGVAQASDKLRAALAELDDHLDQRRFSDAAALGYSDISSNFIFLQRTLGALQASYNRKCSLVSEVARQAQKAFEDVEPFVDRAMVSANPRKTTA